MRRRGRGSHHTYNRDERGVARQMRRNFGTLAHGEGTFDVIPVAQVKSMIVCGTLTRERCCDAKARFHQLDHALKAKGDLEARHGDPGKLQVYPCPFCAGWHLATAKEFQ